VVLAVGYTLFTLWLEEGTPAPEAASAES
jgi:hypothetical protein